MIQNLPYPSIERIMEITHFKSEPYAKAALQTLKWLDKGAPEVEEGFPTHVQFDMGCYLFKGKLDSGNCGTTCCMAGAIMLNVDPAYLKHGAYHLKQAFGIPPHSLDPTAYEHPLYKLFFAHDEKGHTLNDVKPDSAAKTLRRYLFTGVVIWES